MAMGVDSPDLSAPQFQSYRSPLVQETPLAETSSLPPFSPPNYPEALHENDLLHPSFLPPCQHGKGDMHAHAFDLLSLSSEPVDKHNGQGNGHRQVEVVPGSVPAQSVLGLSAGAARPVMPKARRMSSSTTGVLQRGKLGLTGEKERPKLGSSPTPQLFDFTKTDARQPRRTSVVPQSLPVNGGLAQHMQAPTRPIADDMELDMEFGDGDGDDEDDGEIEPDGSGRSGSADAEAEEDGDWQKLALGSGSGGVKGRRKGMVFKCETCSKEYRHPSCLVKHRWEHSPHWKEPTQLSMSKHQQVQMLEAAAILAHLDPCQTGRSLPNDKSLWPAMLSPEQTSGVLAGPSPPVRRVSSSMLRSPPSSAAPLTPSSLREPSSFGAASEHLHNLKPRKSSPSSDSTSSSMGANEPFVPAKSPPVHSRPLNTVRKNSISSSLPRQMADMRFGSFGTPASPQSFGALHATSPAGLRPGVLGGGVFGSMGRQSSSIRSGVADLPEADEDEEEEYTRVPISNGYRNGNGNGNGNGHGNGNGYGYANGHRHKSSSEEAEERRRDEEYGMAGEMEL